MAPSTRDPVCPTAGRPMAQADGGLARVRVPGGRIDAGGLRALAGAAAELGSGVVELTNRANVQLRGVADAGALARRLRGAGLSAGEDGDLRRSVVAAPLGGLDGTPDGTPVLDAVLGALAGDPDLGALSPKWGATIDTGGRHGLAGRRDDVVVTVGEAAVEVRAGGQRWRGAADHPELAAAAVVGAARASLGRPRRTEAVPGVAPPAGPLGDGGAWVGAQPWLGRLDVAGLLAVAAAAERHAGGALRLTPWRGVVLPVTGPVAGARALAELAAAGLLTDPADPASAVVACSGVAGCAAGLADAPADAATVAAHLRAAGAGPVLVHVSGCAKRCAHAAPAERTLVAVSAGRYDVLDGADRTIGRALAAAEAVAGAVT